MIPIIDREKTGRHIRAVMEECGLTALDVQKVGYTEISVPKLRPEYLSLVLWGESAVHR